MIIGNCPVCGAEMRVGTDITNADRIRAMTDEELAEFINDVWDRLLFGNDLPGMCDVCYTDTIQNCKKCWLDWLKQEVVNEQAD